VLQGRPQTAKIGFGCNMTFISVPVAEERTARRPDYPDPEQKNEKEKEKVSDRSAQLFFFFYY